MSYLLMIKIYSGFHKQKIQRIFQDVIVTNVKNYKRIKIRGKAKRIWLYATAIVRSCKIIAWHPGMQEVPAQHLLDVTYFIFTLCTPVVVLTTPLQLSQFLGYLVQIFISTFKLVSDEISIFNPVRERIFDRCPPWPPSYWFYFCRTSQLKQSRPRVCAPYPLIKSLSDLIIKTTDVTHYVTAD